MQQRHPSKATAAAAAIVADWDVTELYPQDVLSVVWKCIYVDHRRHVIRVKEESYLLNVPNILTREEVVTLLQRAMYLEGQRFRIHSILKYHVPLEPQELLSERNDASFLQSVQHIDDLELPPSVPLFHDLHEIVFLLVQPPPPPPSSLSSPSPSSSLSSSPTPPPQCCTELRRPHTKRVWIRHLGNNRTMRAAATSTSTSTSTSNSNSTCLA